MLLRRSDVRTVDIVLDTSLIKAWSICLPEDNRIGFSDLDAMVSWHDRGYDLGYKLHVSVDPRMILPMASVLASANEKKKHGPTLVERTKAILRRVGARLGSLIADSQYRSGRMRG